MFNAPTQFKDTSTQCSPGYDAIRFLCDLTQRQSAAPEKDKAIATAIIRLPSSCCPNTIDRSLATIVVEALNGVLRRWRVFHVGKKFCKGMPSLAAFDAAAAVSAVSFGLGILATLNHLVPQIKFRCPSAASSFTMRCEPGNCLLTTQASTGCCQPSTQIVSYNQSHISAVAFAMPLRYSWLPIWTPLDNRESPEALSGKVY